MLHSLTVSNYILIGSLDISFPEGLVIISGETGAGKSILLGALSLVLGAKADASMVGPHGENCVVEAEFGLDDEIRSLLEQADLPAEGDRLLLRRTVGKSGRSRSFANDEPVSVSVLQELATRLVDIHSQHQTLRLGDERFRREALDLWAGCTQLREECARVWAKLGESRRELSQLEERLTRAKEEQEYNNARWERLDRARLVPGELEDLESEQKQLAHAEEIKEMLCEAQELLAPENGESLSGQLREAAKRLEKAGRFIPSLEPLAQRLESARVELDDIAQEVMTVNERSQASPERLEAVEERLSLLYGLLQKHGVGSLEELIDERDRLEGLVLDATTLVSEVEEARKTVREYSRQHENLCSQLHAAREKGASGFAAAVQEQLRFLELDRAVFQIGLEPCAAGADGSDNVRFLFSAEGRTPSDVSKTASGGELSRIMLSLKAVMARFKRLPTLVFDEIDTGVSGSTADKMGSLVCTMGTQMQVFAITHLPQVAAKGNAHYLVSKEDGVTSVRSLDAEGRVQELARMLSGATITPAAIANAQALLQS
jgi:DNA repair protein RecN (Recombination protein N)